MLDGNLRHYADVIRRELGQDIADVPGAGAAGGLGAGLMVFLNGKLEKGIELVARLTGLEEKVKMADMVWTGKAASTARPGSAKRPPAWRKWPQNIINPSSRLPAGSAKASTDCTNKESEPYSAYFPARVIFRRRCARERTIWSARLKTSCGSSCCRGRCSRCGAACRAAASQANVAHYA